MLKRTLALFGFAALLTSACGDIGMVNVNVEFPDEDTELRTRALHFIVREVPTDRDGCDDLWVPGPSNLPQSASIVEYPNRNDIVAAPVRLAMYEALTILVYAYPTTDIEASAWIAGGCTETPIDAESTSEVSVALMPPP